LQNLEQSTFLPNIILKMDLEFLKNSLKNLEKSWKIEPFSRRLPCTQFYLFFRSKVKISKIYSDEKVCFLEVDHILSLFIKISAFNSIQMKGFKT